MSLGFYLLKFFCFFIVFKVTTGFYRFKRLVVRFKMVLTVFRWF